MQQQWKQGMKLAPERAQRAAAAPSAGLFRAERGLITSAIVTGA
jgi:hypothetical protein